MKFIVLVGLLFYESKTNPMPNMYVHAREICRENVQFAYLSLQAMREHLSKNILNGCSPYRYVKPMPRVFLASHSLCDHDLTHTTIVFIDWKQHAWVSPKPEKIKQEGPPQREC